MHGTMRRTRMAPLLLALLLAAAAVDTAAGVAVNRQPKNGPTQRPGLVMVQFKPNPAAAKIASIQAAAPVVPGLQLTSLVGTPAYEAIKLPTAAGPGAAAVGGATGGLPADAIFKYKIVDGSSVAAKVAQLRLHPGERTGRGRHAAVALDGLPAAAARCCAPTAGPLLLPCSCGRGRAGLHALHDCHPQRPPLPAQRRL